MRVLVIADTDLDGAGSAALIAFYHRLKHGVSISALFPNRKKLNKYFEDASVVKRWAGDYDLIYLCDTGLESPRANKNLGRILGPKTIYLDHHQTNRSRSEKYEDNFLGYCVEEGDRCSAKITYDFLLRLLGDQRIDSENLDRFKEAEEFTTLVNDFDMWLGEYPRSHELADVVAVVGPDRAFNEFREHLETPYENSTLMTESIEAARLEKRRSLQLAKATLIFHGGYKVPIQTALSRGYSTEVGSQLVHPRGIIILFDTVSGTMSARRGAEAPKTADCLEFAHMFGGGGHPYAAGFPSEKVLKEMSREMGRFILKERMK